MLDTLGALFVGAYLTTLLSVLVWSSSSSVKARLVATTAFGLWLASLVTLTALGALAPGTLGPIPPGLAPFSVLLSTILAFFRYNEPIRDALSRVGRPRLIGVHAFRIGGIFFLALGLLHRLPPAFALTAGIGDVVVGVSALVISARLATGRSVSERAVRTWNAVGMLDLVAALTLGVISAPRSPIGILASEPGMRTMATMPWILVPSAIVPVLFLAHVVMASERRRLSAHAPSSAVAATLGPRGDR